MVRRSHLAGSLLFAACMELHVVDTQGVGVASTSTAHTDGSSSTSTGDTSTGDTSTGDTSTSDSGSTRSEDPPDAVDDTGTTAAPTCGDGDLDPGEECDLSYAGNADDASCLIDCTKATCGDGYVYAFGEECDDANDDPADGCHLCARTRKVFVTSDTYQADQFQGLVGADQRCRSLAAQAGLPNFAGYVAWLSDSRTAARDRMIHSWGRYELVNGLLVANSWSDLVDGELLRPIDVTEKSESFDNRVWTGTNPDGTIAQGSDHCADWTSQEFAHRGSSGSAQKNDTRWSIAGEPGDCGGPNALYCFEQD